MSYVALVTDRDAGIAGGDDTDGPVTMDMVMAVVERNVDAVKRLIEFAVVDLP